MILRTEHQFSGLMAPSKWKSVIESGKYKAPAWLNSLQQSLVGGVQRRIGEAVVKPICDHEVVGVKFQICARAVIMPDAYTILPASVHHAPPACLNCEERNIEGIDGPTVSPQECGVLSVTATCV